LKIKKNKYKHVSYLAKIEYGIENSGLDVKRLAEKWLLKRTKN
jgi:hypothetical protein